MNSSKRHRVSFKRCFRRTSIPHWRRTDGPTRSCCAHYLSRSCGCATRTRRATDSDARVWETPPVVLGESPVTRRWVTGAARRKRTGALTPFLARNPHVTSGGRRWTPICLFTKPYVLFAGIDPGMSGCIHLAGPIRLPPCTSGDKTVHRIGVQDAGYRNPCRPESG